MVNVIAEGIQKAVQTEFGSGYPVYIKEWEHEADGPGFYISARHTVIVPARGEHSSRTHTFLAEYVPDSDERTECYEVQDRLSECLEYIYAGTQLIRYAEAEAEVENGILKVSVTYNVQVIRKENPADEMEELEIKGGLKVDS